MRFRVSVKRSKVNLNTILFEIPVALDLRLEDELQRSMLVLFCG